MLLLGHVHVYVQADQIIGAISPVTNGGIGGLWINSEHRSTITGRVTSVSFRSFAATAAIQIYVLRFVSAESWNVVAKVDLSGPFSGSGVHTVSLPFAGLSILPGDHVAFSTQSGSSIGMVQLVNFSQWDGTTTHATSSDTATITAGTCLKTSNQGTKTIRPAVQYTIAADSTATAPFSGVSCAGGASGDPQFAGLQGQSFQVHGFPDCYFSLLSTPTIQMNGRFKYLASAEKCTRNDTICWTHPGTYIDEIGILMTLPSGREMRFQLLSGSQTAGMQVLGDNHQLRVRVAPRVVLPFGSGSPGQSYSNSNSSRLNFHSRSILFPGITSFRYHFSSPFHFHLTTNLWDIDIINSQYFFNLQVALNNHDILKQGTPQRNIKQTTTTTSLDRGTGAHADADRNNGYPPLPIHGFIGNTWKNAVYADRKLYEGDVSDYETSHVFGIDSVFNQYHRQGRQS